MVKADFSPSRTSSYDRSVDPSKASSLETAIYEGRTESHAQLFFACELGTAEEGECGGRWKQLLCYP